MDEKHITIEQILERYSQADIDFLLSLQRLPAVVIMRKPEWLRPRVFADMATDSQDENGTTMKVSIPDFIKMVIKGLGTVTWIVRDATFEKRINYAVEKVVREIKKTSIEAIGGAMS